MTEAAPLGWLARGAPNPGSDAAREQGCHCPVMDNAHGRGRYGDGKEFGWFTAEGCPLHRFGEEP